MAGRNDLNKERRTERMLKDPMAKIMLRMAVPTIMSFLINAIYSLTDTYFVSALGTNATAAVNVNSSLDLLILMLGSMLAVGAASFIARLLGSGDADKAGKVLSTAFFSAMAFGTVMLIAGEAFTYPLVRFLGATPTCERYAADYTRYLLLGAPFMPACFVMNHCLRSEGYAAYSMIGMCSSSILNCILDPIFIFALDMGIAGAAIATTISKLFMFAILIAHYVTGRSEMKLSIRNYTVSREIAASILSVGASSFFRIGLDMLAAILLNRIAGTISDSVLAGVGVCTRIMTFPTGIMHGFCNGSQPVIGINWGANRFGRVKEGCAFCQRTAVAVALVMTCGLLLTAKLLISQFAGSDAEMLRVGTMCVMFQSAALPVYAWASVVNMMCTALGKGGYALLIASSRSGICFIPALFLLNHLFGVHGIASAQAVADVLTLGFAVPIFLKLWNLIRQKKETAETGLNAVSGRTAETGKL